ncbi:hypothetical protein LDC_2527 [sediment metagenome]|uniref:Uncharacterized protein n=1 Tax=sediment metagenome TaxID=749907 RepID=D9PLV1_9ZZZZ
MIITPAFMNRLVLLADKTKRQYEFLFRANTFYVKWNLGKAYLEINTWKKITHNIETFIDWYIEMKEIISFVEDMQILYLSKTDKQFLGENTPVPQYESMGDKSPIGGNISFNLF